MMAWYQILSFFFTNSLRILFGLYLIVTLLQLSEDRKKAVALCVCGAALLTALSGVPVRELYLAGAEITLLVLTACGLFGAKPRMCLFVAFFYEIAVGLWEFVLSGWLGVLFESERFLDGKSTESMAAVWLVRLLMAGLAFIAAREQNFFTVKGRNFFTARGQNFIAAKGQNFSTAREQESGGGQAPRILTGAAVLGLLGVVFLSGQDVIAISDDELTTWMILSMLLPVAILFFCLSRQYEMERRIAQLEKEKMRCLSATTELCGTSTPPTQSCFMTFTTISASCTVTF